MLYWSPRGNRYVTVAPSRIEITHHRGILVWYKGRRSCQLTSPVSQLHLNTPYRLQPTGQQTCTFCTCMKGNISLGIYAQLLWLASIFDTFLLYTLFQSRIFLINSCRYTHPSQSVLPAALPPDYGAAVFPRLWDSWTYPPHSIV